MMTNHVDEIRKLLQECTPEQRQEVFRILRPECSIHPLELQLNTTAEVILSSSRRDQGRELGKSDVQAE